jgi:hypothetical protein
VPSTSIRRSEVFDEEEIERHDPHKHRSRYKYKSLSYNLLISFAILHSVQRTRAAVMMTGVHRVHCHLSLLLRRRHEVELEWLLVRQPLWLLMLLWKTLL